MEDSFRVRVDRAFGSLEATPSLSSLWRLTDQEIERNEWIQDKVTHHEHKDQDRLHRKPYSSLLDNPKQAFADFQDLDEDDSEDDNPQSKLEKEDWDIRSSVGMDCTLDNEEEEDAYDKVAVGRDESADRFYMTDVHDYEVEIDSNNELPNSFADAIRDGRANHMAAKLRLKEDDQSATKSKSENVGMDVSSGSQVVPFFPCHVPDYVRNPSKYTHYTFDSLDDVDEESNRKAYMDLFNGLKRSDGMETQRDAPKSIIFTPKKKSLKKSDGDGKKVYAVSIAAEDDGEVCVMDEDEPETAIKQKGGRSYRRKGSANADEE